MEYQADHHPDESMQYQATLLMQEFVTHDTHRFIITRPEGLDWEPGQGVELELTSPQWRGQGRPFTPTSLREDLVLEFLIKRYASQGVTQALHDMQPGTMLSLSDPIGIISYQGPGVFIAAGTGITPFLAILRELNIKNELDKQSLLFSNKSERDLICGDELSHMLGKRCYFTYTREHQRDQDGHHINTAFLKAHIHDYDQYFYICGPDGFVKAINNDLVTLGVHPGWLVYEH
jgi:cytochrome-b5 reductase